MFIIITLGSYAAIKSIFGILLTPEQSTGSNIRMVKLSLTLLKWRRVFIIFFNTLFLMGGLLAYTKRARFCDGEGSSLYAFLIHFLIGDGLSLHA